MYKTFALVIRLKSGEITEGKVQLRELKPFAKMLRNYGHELLRARISKTGFRSKNQTV